MLKLTDAVIDREHDKLWAEATKTYGSEFSLPADVRSRISEILRGFYVAQLWQQENPDGKNPSSFLNTYSVSDDAQSYVLSKLGIKEEKRQKTEPMQKSLARIKPTSRADKWQKLAKWADANRGKEFTTEQIVKESGFSYQTTLKHISESPLFLKVKKGVWYIPELPSE